MPYQYKREPLNDGGIVISVYFLKTLIQKKMAYSSMRQDKINERRNKPHEKYSTRSSRKSRGRAKVD